MKKAIKELIRSSTLLVSSQFISFLFTILKNKVFAIYLGPLGFGILSAFNSTIDIIVQTFGLGATSAIVRETAANSNNEEKLRQSIYTIKTISLIQAILACLFTFIFSDWLSYITFSTYNYSAEFKVLSGLIFLSMIYRMNISIIEGLVVIKSYAYQTLISTLIVAVTTSLTVVIFGNQTIIAILLITILFNFLVSELVQRKTLSKKGIHSFRMSFQNTPSFLSISLTMFGGGLISVGAIYFSRVLIINVFGLESLGYVQAAQSLAFIFTNFILSGITKYYFPKLVSCKDDLTKSMDLLNAQVQVGSLISIPISLIFAILAPYILPLFYSSDFDSSVSVLRWFLVVGYLKIASWPLSYFLVARHEWKPFLVTELISNLTLVFVLGLTLKDFGIVSVGIAGVAQYIIYLAMLILYLNRENSGLLKFESLFRLSAYGILLVITVVALSTKPLFVTYITSTLISVIISVYSVHKIYHLLFDKSIFQISKK